MTQSENAAFDDDIGLEVPEEPEREDDDDDDDRDHDNGESSGGPLINFLTGKKNIVIFRF